MSDRTDSLKVLLSRIVKLERAVFGNGSNQLPQSKAFKGATGGLRLLHSKGFFNKKRSFQEICKELESNGYNYSKQAVQTPLNNLSKSGGILVSLKEGGKKLYAKRK